MSGKLFFKHAAIVIVVICLSTFGASAQKQADFEKVMNKFVRYYNLIKPDSIKTLTEEESISEMWDSTAIHQSHRDNGNILSCKYAGMVNEDGNQLAVFKTTFKETGVKAITLSLTDKKLIANFGFLNTSDEIEKLISK